MSKISSILVALLVLFSIGGSATAATLNLVTKNTQTWDHAGNGLVVLEYNEAGTDFVYDISGVVTLPNTEYTLMYYVDKEPTGKPESFVNPGVVGQIITTVTSDTSGNVEKSGVVNILSMPFAIDPNGVEGANGGYPGAKVWLVPTTDIVDGINWVNMGNFLYEENLVSDNGGVPSHLITYTETTESGETTADLGVCVEPSVGIAVPETISFGKLYAGESASADLDVEVTEYVSDEDCVGKGVSVSVTVTPGAWTSDANILTTVDETVKSVMVTTTVSLNFVLNAAVGADVVPGSYTEVITVEAVY
jgi:hypothetical protein